MTFRITGLAPDAFVPLFHLDDDALAARGIRRRFADASPGYPCRVSLEDAEVGEELLLLPFEHLAVDSPYRASGPIYVRRVATRAACFVDRVPEQLRRRLVSVRAYDADAMMRGAEVCDGTELRAAIERLFADDDVRYLHVHNARPGCFACRVDRSEPG